MPNIPKIRKAKRVSVLTKRAQCLGKHYKERSYRPCKRIGVLYQLLSYIFFFIIIIMLLNKKFFFPVYEKLKNNNNFLAKALSKEKQNNQSLFTQNVQLIAEIQQLNVICNTRNVSIIYIILRIKK